MTPADYDRLLTVIRALLDRQTRVIAAIDGRCGAGKSTLAAQLQAQLSCRVFHMDDFFLRPEQRTAARLAQPGENVDHERFLSEVLQPALRGEAVVYRPFRCARQALDEPVTVDAAEQLRRIEARSGPEKLRMFRDRWIPLEESYFTAFDLPARCDMALKG